MPERSSQEIADLLAAPFSADEIKWKPGAISGHRALALAYIDARHVMDRLDEVVGLGNWQTKYRETATGVVCQLSVRIGGEWIVQEDFGGFSEQSDDGDRCKAAFSDALKRAAVHFHIGRYLYRLPSQWCDYDPARRTFAKVPQLPAWAIPQKGKSQLKATPATPSATTKKTSTRKTEKVSTPPPQELDRPYDQDQDDAECIERDHAVYLLQEAKKAGWSQEQLLKVLGVKQLRDVAFGRYREVLDSLHASSSR